MKLSRFVVTAASVMALCQAGAASARASGADSADAVDPAAVDTRADDGANVIVVTARRVEERLQDVPISILVFNQEQITQRNLVNVQDLATYTPSLAVSRLFGSENASLSLRGFVQDSGTAPTVGAYFAEVPAGRGGALTTQAGEGAGPGFFFDLQNVQVLKGPQGTLFGRNTTGGAVLFTPQKPTGELGGYAELSYGNYDMLRLQGALNVPLGETARLRIAGERMKRDGYLRNLNDTGPRDFENVDYLALRGSLVVDLTPDLENYTIVSYLHSQTNGSVEKIAACGSGFPAGAQFAVQRALSGLACDQLTRFAGSSFYSSATSLPFQGTDLKQWQVINTTTWQAGDSLTVKNIASYGEVSNVYNAALFGDALRFGANKVPVYGSVIFNPPGGKLADQSTLTEELRLEGKSADGRLTWQAGGYMELGRPLSLLDSRSANLINCTDLQAMVCTDVLGQAFGFPLGSVVTTRTRTWYDDYGLYAQMVYGITDRIKLTGGFRYTWDKQRSEVYRVARQFFPVARNICIDAASTLPDCYFAASAKSSRPTWLVGVDFQPVPDVLLYAKYARGYRAGGVLPTAPRGNDEFAPEKLDAYEIGLKTSFNGTVRGYFNVAAFYNDFRNQQLRAGFRDRRSNSQLTGIVNAGTSRTYGVEVDGSVQPFDGFAVDFAYTYLNTKITKIAPITPADPANYLISVAIPVNAPLFFAPKHKASVTAKYTLPFDEAAGKVTLGATVSYISDRPGNYAYYNPITLAAFGGRNFGSSPDVTLLNLNVSWNSVLGSDVDLSAFATNVTGKKYYVIPQGVGTSFGFESFVVGEPRMYGVRLRYRFGE